MKIEQKVFINKKNTQKSSYFDQKKIKSHHI